jgi:hypothetical protein
MSSNIKDQLLQEIEKTPDSTLKEVLDEMTPDFRTAR